MAADAETLEFAGNHPRERPSRGSVLSVYVDDMEAPFGRMIMCHMGADTTEELLEMVDAIGVARRGIQNEGTVQEDQGS